MTIGSVPPSEHFACIRDVTFRNIKFEMPLKAIYVKTNPGHGSGEISNILYENIVMTDPVWWAIYIGPQQQKQPTGDGPGCMFYPFIAECHTQPLINMFNITIRNLTSTGGLFTPGIIRCNENNPCYGFKFENVHMKGWYSDYDLGFITENVQGVSINSYPDPGFSAPGEPLQNFEMNNLVKNFFLS